MPGDVVLTLRELWSQLPLDISLALRQGEAVLLLELDSLLGELRIILKLGLIQVRCVLLDVWRRSLGNLRWRGLDELWLLRL